MLSYRHGYHAGNFADVVKHSVVSLILQSLHKKDKAFCYHDTHAAAGTYDLSAGFAQKNKEYKAGIGSLWQAADVPAPLAPYINFVKQLNADSEKLTLYPGSPSVARQFLRPQDRMLLCELHSNEVVKLKQVFSRDRQVGVHHMDGYQSLNAFLPPKEKRGMVLIDPAFELPDERERFTSGLLTAANRWPTGIIAGWFPMQTKHFEQRIYRSLRESSVRNILAFELCVQSDAGPKAMYGCGMIIINPPWQLEETLQQVAPWLWENMNTAGEGGYKVHWVVPE